MTIFEDWGKEKERILSEELGLDVMVIKRGTFLDKKQNSTEIRAKIYRQEEWKDTVPNFVYHYIINHGIDGRIRNLLQEEHDLELAKK